MDVKTKLKNTIEQTDKESLKKHLNSIIKLIPERQNVYFYSKNLDEINFVDEIEYPFEKEDHFYQELRFYLDKTLREQFNRYVSHIEFDYQSKMCKMTIFFLNSLYFYLPTTESEALIETEKERIISEFETAVNRFKLIEYLRNFVHVEVRPNDYIFEIYKRVIDSLSEKYPELIFGVIILDTNKTSSHLSFSIKQEYIPAIDL